MHHAAAADFPRRQVKKDGKMRSLEFDLGC